MIRIITADDHTMFREGLTQMLTHSGMDVVAECSNGNDVIDLVLKHTPDIVLLDVSMPGTDGISVADQITSDASHRCKVIILTMYCSADIYLRAKNAGVAGYLLKDCAFSEVVAAIETVMSGCSYVSPSLKDLKTPASAKSLTKREREILRQFANGLTAKEVSEALFISPKTVDVHRTNIMKKLDIHSISSLVSYAHKSGLT